MTKPLSSILGLFLLAGIVFAPACAQQEDVDDPGLDEIEDYGGSWSCPFATTDFNQFHAKYVQAFNADDPPKIGCLYEYNATFVDPATGTFIMGRTNIQNQLVFYQTGTHMVATTRYAIIGGGNVGLLSAAYTIYDDASGGVVAAGQSADVVRRAANNMWMLVVDHPFGGQ